MRIIPPNAPPKASLTYPNCSDSHNSKHSASLTPVSSGVKKSYAQKMLERSQSLINKAESDFLHCLVVRGNPRNALVRNVEFPQKSDSKHRYVRLQGKKHYTKKEKLEHRAVKRSILYKSMALAGNVLNKATDENGNKLKNRVCLCRRYIRTTPDQNGEDKKPEALLIVNNDDHTAKISNLIECDNNWVCPVCSAIHLDRRAKQISKVQKNFLTAGHDKHWSTWMLTLTIPHTRDDALADLLDKKSAVMSDFHAHSAIKKLKARIGWKGYVDSLEVRYSANNGWHPHHHILGFFTNFHLNTRVQSVYDSKRDYYRIATQSDKKRIAKAEEKLYNSYKKLLNKSIFKPLNSSLSLSFYNSILILKNTSKLKIEKIEVEKYIYHIFAYLCVKHGLKRPSLKHGVDLVKTDDIEDYLTKQSKIAIELTSEADKKSTYSRSQWEILRDCEIPKPVIDENGIAQYVLNKDEYNYAQHSRQLFCEFASAVKGKAKIHWSPNFLEQWLGEEEEAETETETEENTESDTAETVYKISIELWNRFFTASDRKHLIEILRVAEEDSYNNTNNTEIHLYALQRVLDKEQSLKRQRASEQNDLLAFHSQIPPEPPPERYYN